MIGLGLKIQNTVVFQLETSEIPGLLSALQTRATYFENSAGTTTILTPLENCE